MLLVVTISDVCFLCICSEPVEEKSTASLEGVDPSQEESADKVAKIAEGASAQELLRELAATAER